MFAISTIAFGDTTGFLSHGGDRGLQEGAVATIPWQLGQIVSGDPYHARDPLRRLGDRHPDRGHRRHPAPVADPRRLAAAAVWWRFRARAIRAGREDLADAAVSRDFVFALVLLVVVISPVLSTQYMVWLLGLAAVVLSAGTTRLARPAWIVVGATVLSTATFKSPELTLIRDLALLCATVDAATAMVQVLKARRIAC